MRKKLLWGFVCIITVSATLLGAYCISRTATAMAERESDKQKICIVIDPGHGEPDGGATSCTGRLEHTYNLEIALRLRELLHFMGFETILTRSSEASIYTEGKTIAQKKMSDLKERVRIVAEAQNGILLSIHQNHFPDNQSYGPVVLYSDNAESKVLAEQLQKTLINVLSPDSRRQCKQADGIYLMEHIRCPGVLIECGFLSNWDEEGKLRNPEYQKKLCCVIGSVVCNYVSVLKDQQKV